MNGRIAASDASRASHKRRRAAITPILRNTHLRGEISPETARDVDRHIIQRVLARLDARPLLLIRLRREVPTRASLCFGVRRQWIGVGFPMLDPASASAGLPARTSSLLADLTGRAVRVLLTLLDYTPERREDCGLRHSHAAGPVRQPDKVSGTSLRLRWFLGQRATRPEEYDRVEQ